MIFLAFLGIFFFQQDAFLLVTTLVCLSGVLLLGWPRAAAAFLRILGRVPVLSRLAVPLARAYEGVRVLIAPANLLWAVVLGAGAWFAECLGFHLVVLGTGVDVGVIHATFIYSFATLFGAVTMLLGGLGPTEGSMSGLLVLEGMPLPDAVAATFVIRVCTLWFAVALGGGALLRYRNQLEQGMEDKEEPLEAQDVEER